MVTGQTEAGTLVRTDWDGRQLSTGHDEVPSVSCRDSATEQSVLSLSPGKPVVGECGISPRAPWFKIKRHVLFVSASASWVLRSASP